MQRHWTSRYDELPARSIHRNALGSLTLSLRFMSAEFFPRDFGVGVLRSRGTAAERDRRYGCLAKRPLLTLIAK